MNVIVTLSIFSFRVWLVRPGPRGFPGEIGISEVITIDGTETVEPNEEAQVQDDFDRNIHHLTFYIPKG